MKTIKTCLLLAFMGLATTASAQFVTSSGNNSGNDMSQQGGGSSFDFTSVKTSGWNRVYVSYNPSKINFSDDDYEFIDGEDIKFKGFTVGYLRGFSLTKKVPLYMEIGLGFQYRNYKYSDEDLDRGLPQEAYEDDDVIIPYYGDEGVSVKYTMMSLNIPINLLYRFNINNDFSISPYFGFDLRFNIKATRKVEWVAPEDYEYDNNGTPVATSDKKTDQEWSQDCFDKKDMYDDDDYVWNRFQAGWHIGVGLDYKALHIGVEYGKDFNELCKKAKLSTTSITLGVNF